MADIDPKEIDYSKITKIMEERAIGYSSADTGGRELAALTGLSPEVAKAFCQRLTSRGNDRASVVRGYKKGEFPKKKAPK
tara:strand:- start:1072 stop:1311 length:240 start_codon:yes stop_codon:yes gene_type:complete